MRSRHLLCLCACLLIAAFAIAQQAEVTPLIGTWSGDWWPYPEFDYPLSAGSRWDAMAGEKMSRTNPDPKKFSIELKWDGEKLTGAANPGPKAVDLQNVICNAKKPTRVISRSPKSSSQQRPMPLVALEFDLLSH
jgi:hypothetical protein